MISKIQRWAKDIKDNRNKILLAILLFILALVVQQYAGEYVDKANVAPVKDLILDHVGPIDISFIYVWLYLFILATLVLYPLTFKPDKIHYYLGIFALVILVRAIFITLTHLQMPPDAINTVWPFMKSMAFSNDLFFSGHVASPFVGFLIIEDKKLKYFMLFSSILLGVIVLLMHVHYSIDVFASFFITYGTFKIGEKIFK